MDVRRSDEFWRSINVSRSLPQMAEQLNVAMIQMQVGKSLSDNLAVARQKCGEATALGAQLIVLPEYFADMHGVGADPRDADHPPQSVELDSICTTLSEIAAQHKVTIHGGSFLERDGDHVYNTTPVYGPDGKLVTTYRKQHPFHCPVVPRGSGNAEIDFITPGQTVSTYEIRGFRIGCAICWDTRFPELFAAYRQAGCDLILCPAVFFAEVPTDIAFWESLLQGRAIDTACYIGSATICGQTDPPTNSLNSAEPVRFNGVTRLIDPMGGVLKRAEDHLPDLIHGTLHRSRLEEARQNFPAAMK